MAHVSPVFNQSDFRGRNDDGTEALATWKALVNIDWSQNVNQNFRVRFVVEETAGGSDNNKTLQLQYDNTTQGTGFTDVDGASAHVRSFISANFTEGDDTTQQISGGTFITPNGGMDDTDGITGGGDLDYAGNDECELEYCVQLVGSDVADADNIQLRLIDGGGGALDAYGNIPDITAVNVSAIGEIDDTTRANITEIDNTAAFAWDGIT